MSIESLYKRAQFSFSSASCVKKNAKIIPHSKALCKVPSFSRQDIGLVFKVTVQFDLRKHVSCMDCLFDFDSDMKLAGGVDSSLTIGLGL